MGNMGMGTVFDFGTLQHTAYPYCGVTDIHGSNIPKLSFYFIILYLLLMFDFHILPLSSGV